MSWSHRLASLEPSPSFATVTPINTSIANQSSRSSPFERSLAKCRSLPRLWLRACGSSNPVHRQHKPVGNIGNDTIFNSLGHFGEFENKYDLLFTYSLLFIYTKEMSRAIYKTFSFFKRCIHLHVLLYKKNKIIDLFFKSQLLLDVSYTLYVLQIERKKKNVYFMRHTYVLN
jgi:hypothetical protein